MKSLSTLSTVALFAALCVSSCVSSPQRESTIICGEVINADSSSAKVLTVVPCDFFVSGERFASDVTQSEFKFHEEFEMTHEHDVVVQYNNEFYTFMAAPRDSIFITIDASDGEIIFGGDKAQMNTQIVSAAAIKDSIYRQSPRFDLNTDVEGVLSQLNDKMEVVKSALDSYCAERGIDDDIKEYLTSNTLFTYSNALVIYDRQQKYSPERYALLSHEVFDLNNPKQASSYMYGVHVLNMMRDFMISNDEIREEVFKDEQDIELISELLLEHTLRQPKSLMRDMHLAQSVALLKQLSDDVSLFYDERYLEESNYTNPKFMESYVRPTLQPEEVPISQTITGDFKMESPVRYINEQRELENLGDVNIIDHIKERYRGKVIYVDIWATWCGPCRIEMGHAPALHKMYEGVDDIAFVNLCFSSKLKSWTDMIEKEDIKGENYFIEGNDVGQVMLSTYKLQGYPSYLLFDKEGNLVTNSAHRPSDLDKLSVQLEALF